MINNITLLSNVDIVKQIFTLVCKKLSINISIINDIQLLEKTDLLIVDSEFLENKQVNYQEYSSKVIIIANKNENINSDFEIFYKPFLPSVLEIFLKNINIEDTRLNNEKSINQIFNNSIDIEEEKVQEDNLDDLISFVDEISNEKEIENFNEYDELGEDDITIKKEDLESGGVLDALELDKLFDMINEDNNEHKIDTKTQMAEKDWIDLSDIIDTAIEDVQEYKFEEDKDIELILNNYSMSELSPLFNKLNQNIINFLSDGREIRLKLRLKND